MPSKSALVAVLLAFAASLRLVGLDKGLWGDEISILRLISPDDPRALLVGFFTYDHPPAYSFLLKLWSLFGSSEAHLRLLSVILGVAALCLTVIWVARSKAAAALPASLMVGTWPIFLRFSQEIRSYALLIPITALAFLFSSQLIREPRRARWYVAVAGALSLAIATHVVAVFLPLAVATWLLLERRRAPFELRLRWFAGAMAAPAGLTVALAAVLSWVGIGNWWMPPPTASLMTRTAAYLASPWWTTGGPSWWMSSLPLLTVTGTILLAVGLAWGDWRRSWPCLAAAAVFFLQVVACSVLMVPVFWYRTLLPGLIPLVGFVAIQLSTARRTHARVLGLFGLCLLAAAAAVQWVVIEAHEPVEDLVTAARLLDERLRPDDLMVFFPAYAGGATYYYSTALRDYPGTPLRVGRPDCNIEEEVRTWRESREQDGVIVVQIRIDTTAQQQLDEFAAAIDAVRRGAAAATRVEVVALLSHDARFVPSLHLARDRMLSDFEVAFGEPTNVTQIGEVTAASFVVE